MSTRTIKLKLLTQTDLVVVETSARTFGEFKAESAVSALGIDWNSAKLIDKASKATFDLDEAVLPAISSVMFVMPTKSKAGADLPYKEVKALIKEYKEKGGKVDFNYTQATTKQLNDFWDKVKGKSVSKVVETVKESKPKFTQVEVKPTVETVVKSQLIDSTTLTDLDVEAKELKERMR